MQSTMHHNTIHNKSPTLFHPKGFHCRPIPHPRRLKTKSTRVCTPAICSTTTSPTSSTTKRIFEQLASQQSASQQAGGAGGGTTYADLQRLDAAWQRMRRGAASADASPAPKFVRQDPTPCVVTGQYDVIICGGTLGIFLATALQVVVWCVCACCVCMFHVTP